MNRMKILLDLKRNFPHLPVGRAPLYVWYKHYYPYKLRKPFYHPKTTMVNMKTAFKYFDDIRVFEEVRGEKEENKLWTEGERVF